MDKINNNVVGYKASRAGLTENEQHDFDDLTQITRHLSADIVGKILMDWYEGLAAKLGTDTGYFYCPYIPLMTTAVIKADTI
jgi:hypothetical protein